VPPLDTSTSSTIASTITTTTGLSIIPITTGAATTCVSDTSTEAFNVQSEDDDDLVGIIVGAVVGGLCIVVAIVIIVLFIVRRRRAKQQQSQSNGDVSMTQYIPYQPTNSSEVSPPPPQRSRGNLGLDKYTIEYKELKFVNELGHGVCIIHVNQRLTC
jgi:hypothetical protein